MGPEELSEILTQYGSLEKLVQDRQASTENLQLQVSKLESQVEVLTRERDTVHAAVLATREKAIKEVKQAGQQLAREIKAAGAQAQAYIESLAVAGANYGNLREESATLRDYLQLARSFRSRDPEDWQALPPEMVQHLLLGLMGWTEVQGRDVAVAPPKAIHGVSSWTRLRLSHILLWALTGTFSEPERKALAARR